ncbi:amidohydrolase family protein [Priestia filamentosa]|uniref:amidohydrolase family protein n=1 Tax=Priestia filamentosa TaxID=1402861 RepID=UPI003857F3FD
MKTIDFENHFYDQNFIDFLSQKQEPPFYNPENKVLSWTGTVNMPQDVLLPQLLEVAEERSRLMKEQGIDVTVLSSSPGLEQIEVEESIEICRKTNDTLGNIIKRYPNQYLGSAVLPVKNPEIACEELERCVKEYGFVSWHTHSNYGETAPDDKIYRPIFKKAAELGVYVYLHPQLPTGNRTDGYGFTVAGPGLGFTLDTITTITRMIVSGLFDELPNLKVVLGHLGEGIPFLLERMDNRIKFLPNPLIKCKEDISYYFKHNILVTTSGNMCEYAFACAKGVLGIDNILFGSDYPYESLPDMMNFLSDLPLTDVEREKLFYKNAVEKLGIHI